MPCAGENSSEISGVEVKQSVSRSTLTQALTSAANGYIKKVYLPCTERLYEEAGFVFLEFSPLTREKLRSERN